MRSSPVIQKLVPVALTVIFVGLLSYFNFKLFVNNYYTIFDLGVSYRLSYLFSTSFSPVNWPFPNFLVSAKPYTKMFYFFTGSTLLVYDSPLTILVDQTIVIGLGSYALFEITRLKTNDFVSALGLQIIYLLFPSTYGYVTQGGNFMVYMEGLLLLNYMFFLKRKIIPFTTTGFLTILTNTWAPGIFIMLYILELIDRKGIRAIFRSFTTLMAALSRFTKWHDTAQRIENSTARRINDRLGGLVRFLKVRLSKVSTPWLASMLFLCVAAVSVFLFNVHLYSLYGLLAASRVGATPSLSGSSLGTLSSLTTGNIGAKLTLFFGQLSPFIFLPLLSVFVLPVIVYFIILLLFTNFPPYYSPLQQYPYQYAAFLFIATAAFLSRVKNRRAARLLLTLMLVSSTISFLVMSPFSVENLTSGQLNAELSSSPLNDQVDHAYSLIPLHSSVFIQNDMPQLMNRAQVYMNGYYSNQTVDYAAINPLPLNHIARAFGGFNFNDANHFADNTSYGIFASVHGVVIFKLYYHKEAVYYVPASNSARINSSYWDGQPLASSEYGSGRFIVSPGVYNVTFVLGAASYADLPQSFQFRVVQAQSVIFSAIATEIVYNSTSNSYLVSYSFNTSNFKNVEFALCTLGPAYSQGTFTLTSILVKQTSY